MWLWVEFVGELGQETRGVLDMRCGVKRGVWNGGLRATGQSGERLELPTAYKSRAVQPNLNTGGGEGIVSGLWDDLVAEAFQEPSCDVLQTAEELHHCLSDPPAQPFEQAAFLQELCHDVGDL